MPETWSVSGSHLCDKPDEGVPGPAGMPATKARPQQPRDPTSPFPCDSKTVNMFGGPVPTLRSGMDRKSFCGGAEIIYESVSGRDVARGFHSSISSLLP